ACLVSSCGGGAGSGFESAPMSDQLRQLLGDVAAVRALPPPDELRVGTIPRAQAAALVQRALTGSDRDSLERTGTLYRLLGHLAPGEDYLDDYVSFLGSALIGLYVPKDRTLWIVDYGPLDLATLTPTEKGAVIHELTHAIQDANFDLSRRVASVGGDLDGSLALTCVIEGDAVANQNL